MKHILVHIEAGHEARTRSAVDQAIQMYRAEPCVIHLLHVQPQVSGHVASYFDAATLHDLLSDWGTEDLAPAKALLDAAGVPYTPVVRIGRSANTIAAAAREFGCDRIIFGVEPPGLAERLFGSIAQQVRHLLTAQGDPQVIGS